MDSRSILVVDDDDDVREVLTLLLASAGYSVEGAADGVEAWDKMTHLGAPGLVLLDLRMPRMSGGELLQRMRQQPGFSHTAVVVVSGDSEGMQRSEAPPVVAWLRKPVELPDLMRVVEERVPPAHAPAP